MKWSKSSRSFLTLCLLLIPSLSFTEEPQTIPNTQSSTSTLYEDSSPIDTDSTETFTVTYQNLHSTVPQVFMGIKSYEGNDPWMNELMTMQISQITTGYFTVFYQQIGYTKLTIIAISYITFEDSDTFQVDQHIIQIFNNISTGSGQRYDVWEFDYNANGNSASEFESALTVIGFWLRSGNGFNISSSVQILNSSAYSVNVSVDTDALIEKIIMMVLITHKGSYPPTQLQTFFYLSQTINHTQTDNNQISIQYSNSMHFFMGLSGINHVTSSNLMSFYWERQLNSTSVSIIFPNNEVDNIIFTYLVVGRFVCDSLWSTSGTCTDSCSDGQTTQPQNSICEACSIQCLQDCTTSAASCPSPPTEDNFALYFLILLLVPIVLIIILVLTKKKKRKIIENKSLEEYPSIQL